MRYLQIIVLISGAAGFVNAQKIVLTGTVYDPNGAVIVKARVTAVSQKGEKFEALTDEDGVYELALPYLEKKQTGVDLRLARYDVTVDAHGFEKFTLKGFRVTRDYDTRMRLDFALDVLTMVQPITIPSAKYKRKQIYKEENNS